jgi:hypothetical protein
MAVRAWGEDIPSKPKSADEEDEERGGGGDVTPPPPSSLHETLPPFGDILNWQVRVKVDVRQLKQAQTETRPSTGLLPQPCLTLLSPNSWGSSVVVALMEPTHLLGIL